MLLTVLGCSGSVPGPESPASGYLLRAGDTSVLLDLGNGTFGALQRYLDPFTLDGLILSHLHPDHCADI
ncbi:MAG: MBL fold metallo-hydrolase, partial [Pseudonocardiaceae bacterium]